MQQAAAACPPALALNLLQGSKGSSMCIRLQRPVPLHPWSFISYRKFKGSKICTQLHSLFFSISVHCPAPKQGKVTCEKCVWPFPLHPLAVTLHPLQGSQGVQEMQRGAAACPPPPAVPRLRGRREAAPVLSRPPERHTGCPVHHSPQ